MSFKPDPKQTLYMLRLIFGPAEPKLKDLNLEPVRLRKELEAQGLIRLEKRGLGQHVLLTDKGWQWMQAHLNAPIDTRNSNPARVLAALLPRLQQFLERKGNVLADLFHQGNTEQRAHAALLALGGGKTEQRLTVAEVRAALPDMSREAFDKVLLQLQEKDSVALYHEDSPEKRSTEIEAGAIQVAGSRYHLVYLLK